MPVAGSHSVGSGTDGIFDGEQRLCSLVESPPSYPGSSVRKPAPQATTWDNSYAWVSSPTVATWLSCLWKPNSRNPEEGSASV